MENSSDLFDILLVIVGGKIQEKFLALWVSVKWRISGFVLERDNPIAPFDSDELFYMVLVLNENVNNRC